jgi:hypothetical protein
MAIFFIQSGEELSDDEPGRPSENCFSVPAAIRRMFSAWRAMINVQIATVPQVTAFGGA